MFYTWLGLNIRGDNKNNPWQAAMTNQERNPDDDSYDEGEEDLRDLDPDQQDRAYFPLEHSRPPHY